MGILQMVKNLIAKKMSKEKSDYAKKTRSPKAKKEAEISKTLEKLSSKRKKK